MGHTSTGFVRRVRVTCFVHSRITPAPPVYCRAMSDSHESNERLAAQEGLPELPDELLADLADLVLRLHARSARKAGAILSPAMLRTYAQRSETERLGMRAAVQHVFHALILRKVVSVDP